ncbi:unnamed protein product [Microthlaspi erraticum]|uniref:RNA-dependent RNA polymerase n=1 Tax=Microthlaspi erraticum TaxID=1685480 RepID=A0A6D2IPN1_9BRAS|nr:unnamed protein product [Microthlaspi erraticum]
MASLRSMHFFSRDIFLLFRRRPPRFNDKTAFATGSQIVPLLNAVDLGTELAYEILFQLNSRLSEQNIMSCQRAYVTPSKVYLLGPEVEASNYVVKNFAEHASDFMRVTFVEEDWSKLPANALSVNSKEGWDSCSADTSRPCTRCGAYSRRPSDY